MIGILARTTFVSGEGCIVTSTNTTVLAATFIYTMVFDLLILLLNAWKLAMPRDIRGNREEGAVFGETRSKLMTLIFIDGLVYFITAFGINLVAAVWINRCFVISWISLPDLGVHAAEPKYDNVNRGIYARSCDFYREFNFFCII